MTNVTLELKVDKTATYVHAGRVTAGNLSGTKFTRPQDENWTTDSYWVLGTNYWATNCTANVWRTCWTATNIKRGDHIPLGFDDNGVSGHTSVQMRLKFDSTIVKEVTHDNTQNDFSYYTVSGMEAPTPTYLETLDKLDQWSSAQYIPNSRDQLNL